MTSRAPRIRPATLRLFRTWHDGVPNEVVSVPTNWAPHYGYMGVAQEISYYSTKYSDKVHSPQHDVPAEYRHVFEGAPCHVWGGMHDGRTYNGSGFQADVPKLGDLLELIWLDQETDGVRRVACGRGHVMLCAIDRRRLAIVDPREPYVPLILTNTIVAAEGITDR